MAIVIREVPRERDTQIDESALTVRRRSWYAIADSQPQSDYHIIEAFTAQTGIRRGTTWQGADGATDPTCRAVSLAVKHTDEYLKWEVICTFSSARASGGGGRGGRGFLSPRQQRENSAMQRQRERTGQEPPSNPVLRPQVVRWGRREQEEGLEFDAVDGLPVQNAAGDKFVPPPTKTVMIKTVTIERNELIHDNVTISRAYENKVNSDAFTIRSISGLSWTIPIGVALCKGIDAEEDYEGGIIFFKVTYHLEIDWRGWNLKIPNMGLRALFDTEDPDLGVILVPILDKYTGPVSEPRKLNDDGSEWVEGQDEPAKLEFRRYEFTSFAGLRL